MFNFTDDEYRLMGAALYSLSQRQNMPLSETRPYLLLAVDSFFRPYAAPCRLYAPQVDRSTLSDKINRLSERQRISLASYLCNRIKVCVQGFGF